MVAIMASFCCRDQDESGMPEDVLLFSAFFADFQIVVIFHLPAADAFARGKGKAGTIGEGIDFAGLRRMRSKGNVVQGTQACGVLDGDGH